MSSSNEDPQIIICGLGQMRPDSTWYRKGNYNFTYKDMTRGFWVTKEQVVAAEERLMLLLRSQEIDGAKLYTLPLVSWAAKTRIINTLEEIGKQFTWLAQKEIVFEDGSSVQVPEMWRVAILNRWAAHVASLLRDDDKNKRRNKPSGTTTPEDGEKTIVYSNPSKRRCSAITSTQMGIKNLRTEGGQSFYPLRACYLTVTDNHDASRTAKVAIALLTTKWTDDGVDIDLSRVSFDTLADSLASIAFDRERELLRFVKLGYEGRRLLERNIECDDDLRDAIAMLLERGSMEICIELASAAQPSQEL